MKQTQLILGSAMWGWTVERAVVFAMLEAFYAAGYREVDTATNYPIDKNPQHWRLAETWLAEWIAAHGIDDLRVMIKVGSINNRKTPDQRLNRSFLLMQYAAYRRRFGTNLDTFMVHWDNRNDPAAIAETVDTLATLRAEGVRPGLSGIRHPARYARANATHRIPFRIQVKHNLVQSDYARYVPFHGTAAFIAYGINAGGYKLNRAYTERSSLLQRGGKPETLAVDGAALARLGATVSPPLTVFNEWGMLFAHAHPDFSGILLGTSRLEQLQATLRFGERLARGELNHLYPALAAKAIP